MIAGPVVTTFRRDRDDAFAFANSRVGLDALATYELGFTDGECPATTVELRPVLDLLVARVEEAGTSADPGWIVEIGCEGGRWTEWIAMTMKSLHTAPGALRLKLAVLDGLPAAIQLMTDRLQQHCLPGPEAIRICHNGQFALEGDANLVFAFRGLDLEPTVLNTYLESIARVLRPGGKLLLSLTCQPEFADENSRTAAIEIVNGQRRFAGSICEYVENNFGGSLEDALPVGRDRVFVELTRR